MKLKKLCATKDPASPSLCSSSTQVELVACTGPALAVRGAIPLQKAGPDFRSLGIQSDGNTGVHSVLFFVHFVGDAHILHSLCMVLVRPMREVHPSNIHSILNQLQ